MATLKPDANAAITPPAGTPVDLQPDQGAEITAPSGKLRRLGDAGLALAKGVIALPEAAVGVADLATGGNVGKFLENEGGSFGFRPKEAKAVIDTFRSPEQRAADQNVAEAEGFLPTIGAMVQNPSTIANAALESAPSMLGGVAPARLALAAAPRLGAIGAGALGEGVIAAGQNAEQVRQETDDGLLTGGQSAVIAASGLATGALGFGAGRVANRLGLGDVNTILAQGRTGVVGSEAAKVAAEKGLARRAAEGFAVEGILQELPQSAQEQAAQNIALGKPLTEGVGAAAAQGMLVGGLTGVAGGVLSGGTPAAPAPVAPVTSPFSRALGLPAPGAAPIVVGPDGQAITPTQSLDERNASAERLRARGANPGDIAEVPGAGRLGGYGDITDVVPRAPAGPLASAIAAAPAGQPLLNPEPEPTVAVRAQEYADADAADRSIYDQIFGADDVADADPAAPDPYAFLDDDTIPWDVPSNVDTPTAMQAMGFTDEEIRDAIAHESRRQAQGGASGGGVAQPGPQATSPADGPAQAGEGQQAQAREEVAPAARAPSAAPSPAPPPAPAPAAPKVKADPKDLFRTPAERIGARTPDLVEHTTGKGKVLRGVIRKGMTLAQAKEIDSGAFMKNGGAFIRERSLDKLAAFDAANPASAPAAAPAQERDGFKAARAAKQGAADGSNVLAAGRPVADAGGTAPAGRAGAGEADPGRALDAVARTDGGAGAGRPAGRGRDAVAGAPGRQDAGPVADRAERPAAAGVARPGRGGNDAVPAADDRVGPAGQPSGAAGADAAGNRAAAAPVDLTRTERDQLASGRVTMADIEAARAAPAPAVSANTIFTEDAAAAARARMKRKLGTLNSGIDPELLQDGITLAGYHIERGARTFAAYARAMLDDMGEGIRPYLKQLYMAVKFDPRATALEGMDGAGAVETADVDAIPATAAPAPAPAPAPSAEAIPLYSQMRVAPASVEALTKWASSQGIPSVVDDMHVTVGYSSTPVDASAVPLAPATTIGNSAERKVQTLGDGGAVVLMLGSFTNRTQSLQMAHQALRDAGASWDYEGYQPHITITYNGAGLDLSKIKPYNGPIDLLGEERSPIETDREVAEDTTVAASTGLTDRLYDLIAAGKMPANNLALKRLVSEFDGKAPDQVRMKDAQEALEAAIVRTSRTILRENADLSARETFDELRRLYDIQPLLNVRTSTSIANQAYSTPAPLAFLGSELAAIRRGKDVLEPTAGTGMLLMGATPSRATVNELNDTRAALLRAQGFTVTQNDAATGAPLAPAKSQDAVITNPPFGSVKDAQGNPTKVAVDGYRLGQIDHLIAARALETMKDDGKAVLILGANKVAGGVSSDDMVFMNWLYGRYNVAGHFEVSGDLYQRQGAGWPVRVITINGRQESARVAPLPGTIQRANTWEDVYGQYEISLAASQQRPVVGASARPVGTDGQQAGPAGAPRPAGRQAAAPGGPQPGRGAPGPANVAGAGAGTVADRGNQPRVPVGTGDSQQRLGAEPVDRDRLGATGNDRAATGPVADGNPGGAGLTSEENQFQATYVARSSRKDANVLIPVNMKQPLQDALSALEDAVGDIDQYVVDQLGYRDARDMHNALMGLQVDSVAAAIYQADRGKAVIIADQTGIGKGRQAAAVIRWAVRQGHVPVFVSVKPSLFTDMYGDLRDIGTTDVTPFVMNADAWVSSPDGEKLFANRAGHRKVLEQIRDTGELPAGTNAVFMTYSQVNTENVQRGALASLAPRAVFILDESHNAGGESNTGEFVRGLLEPAKGVTYLSATYAKRPDNMPLYFKTDVGDALGDTDSLMTAMAAGGLPLQTVISANLVKAGQMFRRERSYDGVQITAAVDTANRAAHEKLSDTTTEALRAIVAADRAFHGSYVKELDKKLRAEGARALDNAGNQASAGVQHTEFSSVVHNFVKQMLLGLKAQGAADRAIEQLKAGKKPLIAVENTMGSFLEEYVESNGIKDGESLGSFDYRTVLSRALERSRVINEVLPTGEKRKRSVSLSEIGAIAPEAAIAYRNAQRVIDGLTIDIPVSPIDWMRSRIEAAGYSVMEITGRNRAVDYSDPKRPTLTAIDLEEQRDKVRTTRRFNAGELDAIILNVSGSTGISLHASEKFADRRKRHMIVAQPASDINIFMQMLGRIHRTGQVELPEYTLLSADLPTEKRPTALLSKKMKSLNANTSSNTESATSVQAADMLNKYGDQVVARYLADHPALSRELGIDTPLDAEGNATEEDMARKATGRLALQSIATQEAFYGEVEEQYGALIDYLNKTGQNDLEPRTLDFDARETRQEVLAAGTNPESPFGQDAVYGEYSIKAQGTPMKPAEIRAAMAENLAGMDGTAHAASVIAPLDADLTRYLAGLESDQRDSVSAVASRAKEFIRDHAIGKTFRVEINGESYNAVVTNLRSTHKKGGNPFSMSKVQVTIALNGALRSVTVPATQFAAIETSSAQGTVETLFREQPANQRETAKIVTGNLLSAYGEIQGARGSIVSFTKADGTVEQGILLPKAFSFDSNVRKDYRLPDGAAAVKFLTQSADENIRQFGINTRDSAVRVTPATEGGITIRVPKSKLRGGKYFLDQTLLEQSGDFVSQGGSMVAEVNDPAKAAAALDVIMRKQALYALPSMATEARAIVGEGDALLSAAPSTESLRTSETAIRGSDIPTKAASAAHQAKATQLRENLRAQYGDLDFQAVEPDNVGGVLGQALQAVRSTASRLFGQDVVFVKFAPGQEPLFNGAASAKIPGTVFVRIDASRPHMAVLGHELLHNLRTMDPRLYRVLDQRLQKLYKTGAPVDYFQKIRAAYEAKGKKPPADWDEEMNADIVGDHFMDPEFWRALAEQGEPGQFRILVNAILKFIDRLRGLMTGARPFGTDQYLSDLDAAREAVVQALGQFSADQLANPYRRPVPMARSALFSADEGAAPMLSITTDPKALMGAARESAATWLNTPGKVNWWHKTVGTPYNLAQRNPAFKRVFDNVQDFIKDVSKYATEAADLAPRILPQLNTLADLKKKPLSAEDTKVVSRATFEGTLTWARDERGQPIKMTALEARYEGFTPDQKAGLMLRKGLVAENELKRWQALPIDSYEGAVRNRFDATVLKAGVVWKPAELKSMFGMDDRQVSIYQEGRAALDKSLTDLALSDMVRFGGKDLAPIADQIMEAGNVTEASEVARDYLSSMAQADSARSDTLLDTANKIIEKADRANDLMKRGYAPLSRFGTYSLDVVDDTGERAYFGLFETRGERAAMAKKMAAQFPGATIRQGTVSQESHKLFAGVTPETLELFGEMLNLEAQGGDASSQAFQQYLKLAKGNRSAMKRLIERKGIAGFDEDFGRVLAGFITSNSRQVSGNLHAGQIREATADIDQTQGEAKDAAIKLAGYVSNPQEEAGGFRGLLFAQYIGGSIASAMVNLTQPIQTTLPYLSQFGGAANAAKHVRRAAADAAKATTGDAGLDAALKRADERGITLPQEIHQLQGQAMGNAQLMGSDGTRLGDAKALANNSLSRLQLGWGKLFSTAESYNRRLTFIAAYRLAQERGDSNPFAFAEKTIAETQFVANKGNRPRWARGAVGATLFTFKSYSVNYIELLGRMATAGEPGSPERAAGQRAAALALGVLFIMGGAGGLPFAEDLGDLIDGVMQRLGYNFNTKQKRQEFLEGIFGQAGAQFVERGVSGISGVPIDVSGRMGMGNLLPGTGFFTKKADFARDTAELFGPAGDFVKRAGTAAGQVVEGDAGKAVFSMAPKAVTNLRQGIDMATTGMYRDQRGKKIIDTDGWEALTKAIGFQPNDVARVQEASFTQQNAIAINRMESTAISDMWAAGIAQRDPEMVVDAQKRLRDWNEKNPESPIRPNLAGIAKKAQTLNLDKATRIERTAPKAMRAEVRENIARELGR